MVILRGASKFRLDNYFKNGDLPSDGGFAYFNQQGSKIKKILPVDSGLTSTATVSLLTGTYPEVHGIVGNTFHNVTDPISRLTSGFGRLIETDSIIESGLREGKRIINISTLNINWSKENPPNYLNFLPGNQLASSKVLTLLPSEEGKWKSTETSFEYSEALQPLATDRSQLNFQIPNSPQVNLYALAVDTQFDGKKKFDSLILDFDRDISNGYNLKIQTGKWEGFTPEQTPKIGAWLKLINLETESPKAKLYFGAIHQNRGGPDLFIETISNKLGFYPGMSDFNSLSQGLIDEQTYLEQTERWTKYINEVLLLSIQTFEYDLMIIDEPVVDMLSHQFLLTSPRQTGYLDQSGAKRTRYANYVKLGYQLADKNLKKLINSLPAQTSLVVVSPYGMVPVHTSLGINKILSDAGFRVTGDDKAELRAVASGPLAHIYINLTGREKNGIVSEKQFDEYVERTINLLRQVRDTKTNELIFDKILKRQELGNLKIGHPSFAGDIVVLTKPGYVLNNQLAAFSALPSFLGDHGHSSKTKEMEGLLLIYSPRITQNALSEIKTVDVAPIVSNLIGLSPPNSSADQKKHLNR